MASRHVGIRTRDAAGRQRFTPRPSRFQTLTSRYQHAEPPPAARWLRERRERLPECCAHF
jgi:hypothetical protein